MRIGRAGIKAECEERKRQDGGEDATREWDEMILLCKGKAIHYELHELPADVISSILWTVLMRRTKSRTKESGVEYLVCYWNMDDRVGQRRLSSINVISVAQTQCGTAQRIMRIRFPLVGAP